MELFILLGLAVFQVLGAFGMGLPWNTRKHLAKAPCPGGEKGGQWKRSSKEFQGTSFLSGTQVLPCIMSYDNHAYRAYTMKQFKEGGHMLPCMKSVTVASRLWRPVEEMRNLCALQAEVYGVLYFLAQHVLHPECSTCGATPPGSVERLPFHHHLLLRRASGHEVPACMPAQATPPSRGQREKVGESGGGVWTVLASGYISIHMGYRRGKPGHRKLVAVREMAHRLVCWAFYGPPLPGQECAHLCGCVNCLAPLHLKWVSRDQNRRMRDWHGKESRRPGKLWPD